MGKKTFSVVLILVLCMALCPAALATGTADSPTELTESDAAWGNADSETWYVVNDDLTIADRVEVTGNVNLTLADEGTLTAQQGIHVPEGSSLTIWDQSGHTGALSAQGNGSDAGIGGNSGASNGSITIHGGVIYVVGGIGNASGAAAIGGGSNGSGKDITITGGTIIAIGGADETGGNGASAIGGGSNGSAENITITGGIITAKAGDNDTAAIGATPEFNDFAHITYGNDTSNTASDTVVEQTGEEKADWSIWHWVRIQPLDTSSTPDTDPDTDPGTEPPETTVPKTGDENIPWLWALMLAGSLAGLGFIAVSRRRGNER